MPGVGIHAVTTNTRAKLTRSRDANANNLVEGMIFWVFGLPDPIERIAPDAIVFQSRLSGAVTTIQDDPDSPDANWLAYP